MINALIGLELGDFINNKATLILSRTTGAHKEVFEKVKFDKSLIDNTELFKKYIIKKALKYAENGEELIISIFGGKV